MKKDDIKKASEQYANDVCRGSLHRSGLEQYCMVDFMEGAKWRINSVWHDVKERPDENEPTIIEKNNGKTFFAEKGYKGPWKYNVEQFGFKRWSYIKDLIPTEE